MNPFSVKRLSVLVSLAFAAQSVQSETPTPPPAGLPDEAPSSVPLDSVRALPQIKAITTGSPQRRVVTKAADSDLMTDEWGVAVGDFFLYPEFSLRQTYDSNIFAENRNTVSDAITTPSAAITGRSNWTRHRLTFEAGIDADNYWTNTSQDVYNYWLGVEGRYDLSPVANIFGGLRHSRENEERGSVNPLFSIDPTTYYSTQAHVGTAFRNGPVVVRAGATVERLDYLSSPGTPAPTTGSNDDRDQLQYAVGARVGYELSPALTPFIQVMTDTRDYDRALDGYGFQRSSNGYRASIGATWKPGTTLDTEAFLGKLYQSYDDARFGSISRPYFGASLTWKPQPTTRVQALVDRSLNETTIPGASGFIDTTVLVEGEHAVSRDLVVNARLAHSWNDYQGVGRDDKVAFASTGVRYYIDPAVFLGVDLQVINRNSSDPGSDYFRNKLMFTLGYTPGRKKAGLGGETGEPGLLSGWQGQSELHGSITPKLAFFNHSGNSAYLNRYDSLAENLGGNRDAGFIGDIDFNLRWENKDGSYLALEREGTGEGSQRMRLERIGQSAKLAAHYSVLTTATGTLNYFFNPDRVPGGTDPTYAGPLNTVGESTHVAYFNNDSPGINEYSIKRTSYGGSVVLLPSAFNDVASIELGFDGYKRKGMQLTNYVLDSFSLLAASGTVEQNQWRGYARPINEQSGRMTYNFTAKPFDTWLLNYEFSVNKFENKNTPLTFTTLSQLAGPSLQFDTGVVDMNTPLQFNPDSTLYSNSLRLNKQFGDVAAVSGGASLSRLEQNNFSDIQNSLGYTAGRIDTASGYLIGKFNASRAVGLEAFVRYNRRENNSSFPVTGFYDPVSTNYADPRMVAPRINKLTKLSYGLEAKLYPKLLKSTWSIGWLHEDKESDLTYGTTGALAAPLMLYGTRYASDELYLKMISRPAPGWVIRVTPAYLWAKQAQLVTDPTEMFKLKTSVAYTKPEWNELSITGYYNYKHKKNDSLSYSDYSSLLGFNSSQNQKATNRMQAAGVNLSLVPNEGVTVNLGYDWTQNDLSTYYFTTNRMRFDYLQLPSSLVPTPLDFLILDQFNYNADNHAITAGLEKQWGRYLFSASYSLNLTKGHNANGLAGQTLPLADDKLDNRLHTLALGMDYALEKNMSLRAAFIHDRFTDRVNDSLSGNRSLLWMGVNLRY